MIRKIIRYIDFNDLPQTEEHFFHLSKSELIAMEAEVDGGMAQMLETIGKSNNGALIIKTISDFVLRAYGAKSPDGRKFEKNDLILENFKSSAAFDALLFDLVDNPMNAVEFINGIIPKDLQDSPEVRKAVAEVKLPENHLERAKVPDPNHLDNTQGTWPAGDPRDMTTGLDSPRDDNGGFLPWAFREPTQIELAQMSRPRLQDAFRRKNSGWIPRDQLSI